MEKLTGVRLFLATVAGAGIMAGCTTKSGLGGGEVGVAQKEVWAVENYNSPQRIKPQCQIPEGQIVLVKGTTQLNDGTPQLEILSGSCDGYVEDTTQMKKLLGME